MIIDFRVRVPYKMYKNAKIYQNISTIENLLTERFGKAEIPESIKQFSMEHLMKEIDQCGVDKIVVPVRKFHGGRNEDLVELIDLYPQKIIGLIGIEPNEVNFSSEKIIEEIKAFVLEGNCQGISIEPGQGQYPWEANDKRMYEVYEYCEQKNIPIAITFGGISTKSLRYYSPIFIDDIARDFPNLKLALAHGGWPYVTEVSQIVINRKNIFLAPDFYMMNAPGCSDYIMGANHILQNNIIFSSAYPLIPIAVAKEYFMNCGLLDNVLPKIMGENACRFLGIE